MGTCIPLTHPARDPTQVFEPPAACEVVTRFSMGSGQEVRRNKSLCWIGRVEMFTLEKLGFSACLRAHGIMKWFSEDEVMTKRDSPS